MGRQSNSYIQARRLLGRGESWNTTGQPQEIEVSEDFVFASSELQIDHGNLENTMDLYARHFMLMGG